MTLNRYPCDDIAESVRAEAMRLGFTACGFARAEPVGEAECRYYEEWIASGRNGCMDYAKRYCEVRDNPQLLLEGAKTVISVALGYYPAEFQDAESPQFSYYAYGSDYHDVVKARLRVLAQYIKELTGCDSRVCVDTAPIREKYWAQRAGIGFVGRNNLLIIPGKGSFYFLGELVTTLELPPDEQCELSCGDCRRCEQACPAGALQGGAAVDATRCLSCLLIENRGELPEWVGKKVGKRIYGCDTCQQCCPHNARAEKSEVPEFTINRRLQHITAAEISTMTEEDFRKLFRHSAVRRIKLPQLLRNLAMIQ